MLRDGSVRKEEEEREPIWLAERDTGVGGRTTWKRGLNNQLQQASDDQDAKTLSLSWTVSHNFQSFTIKKANK